MFCWLNACQLPPLNLPEMRWATPLICLLAGLVSVFAYAPFGLWPLQIASLAVLFYFLERSISVRNTAMLSFSYCFGWLAFGVYWPYVSMHRYGDMPVLLAGTALGLLAALLAIIVTAGICLAAIQRKRHQASNRVFLLLLLPSSFLLGEWLRAWIFTGFPWLSSGYAHTVGPLSGFAPIVGVYGIGGISAFIAASLVLALRWRRAMALALTPLLLGAVLSQVAWTQASGQAISVRLLQGNIPQDEKFAAENYDFTLKLYDSMLREQTADLIASPETAIPDFAERLPPSYLAQLDAYATEHQSRFAVGIMHLESRTRFMNSVMVMGAAGKPSAPAATYLYSKHHLVPFGEFIPWGFHWFVDMLHIPIGDQTSGPDLQPPFPVRDQWVLPNICYEDLFGEEIAAQIRDRIVHQQPAPTLLLNMSNMAWFGEWLAVPQHLQISQMRALETGRSVMRSANTGATVVIGPKAQVEALLPYYTRGALTAKVQGYSGTTPYILLGNALPVGLAMLLLLALEVRKRLQQKAQA